MILFRRVLFKCSGHTLWNSDIAKEKEIEKYYHEAREIGAEDKLLQSG